MRPLRMGSSFPMRPRCRIPCDVVNTAVLAQQPPGVAEQDPLLL
jgi:hypothetical protein